MGAMKRNLSKSLILKILVQNFSFTEEMFQRRLIVSMKEKQESHEKIAPTKIEELEKDVSETINKLNGMKVDERREQIEC